MSGEERGEVFMKSNSPEPLVVDKEGNIYYSAKVINELENEEKQKLEQKIERLNKAIKEIEKEIGRLLNRQYESERFAKEHGFDTYLPAKENLLCVKNKLQELKGSDKE